MLRPVVLLLIAVTLLGGFVGAAAAAPTRLASEGAYPPFNFLDEAGNPAGFEIDLGNELCRRAGLECVWVINDWDGLMAGLLAGRYDAILSAMNVTQDRKNSVDFTQSYFPTGGAKYLAPVGRDFDLSALSGLTIGALKNTPERRWRDSHLKDGNTLVTLDTIEEAVAGLKSATLDLVFAESTLIDEAIASAGGALVAAGPITYLGEGVGIGFRKSDDALKLKFDDALAAIKANGWLDQLIASYFPEMGPGPFFAQ